MTMCSSVRVTEGSTAIEMQAQPRFNVLVLSAQKYQTLEDFKRVRWAWYDNQVSEKECIKQQRYQSHFSY